jgi:hypothetical protein
MPSKTLNIAMKDPKHKLLVDSLSPRVKAAESAQTKRHTKWREAEEKILAYVPEHELDAKRRARREDGTPAYTTIQIPYTYALLMSAHTYWTSVFFARSPVHQFSGRHGETENQVQAMEALVDYQVNVGGMLAPYYIWLYDAGKYGCGILGSYWEKEVTQWTTIETDPAGENLQVTRQMESYEGNKVYNVSPYDFFPDPRVAVGQFQTGEFLVVKKRIPWNTLVRRKAQGYYMNLDAIKTKVGTSDPPSDQHSVLQRPGDEQFQTLEQKHPAIVEAYEIYVELIPVEWKLGTSEYPEKWVFTITKDLSLLIGVQPFSFVHAKFPFDIIETEIEAYGQWNRGIPEIMEPVQNTMDWLVNSHFFNVRSSLRNLFIGDPTKIVMKDFENTEDGGFIRLKPEAYGLPIETFFRQLQINDVTQQHLGDLQVMQSIGERVLGVNDQIMGALSGGGRRTATEIRTSTGFGVNRLKTISEYISATAFTTLSQKLVQNSQQYYTGDKKFRIVGSLVQEAGPKFLNISPDNLGGFFDFVPVDGTLPVDRFAQANLWKELLTQMSRVPQVMAQYDLGRIFGWVASLAGLKNISQFKIQIMPPGMQPPGSIPISPQGMGMGSYPPSLASAPDMTGIAPFPTPTAGEPNG